MAIKHSLSVKDVELKCHMINGTQDEHMIKFIVHCKLEDTEKDRIYICLSVLKKKERKKEKKISV